MVSTWVSLSARTSPERNTLTTQSTMQTQLSALSATSTTWNNYSAGLLKLFTEITQKEPQDVSPTWSRVLGGSLYSIDGTLFMLF